MSDEITLPRLGGKQKKFVDAYLGPANCNGVKAAKLAGYEGSYSTLGVQAHQNLKNPKLAAHITAGLEHLYMTRSEVLAEIALIARASVADAIDADGRITIESLRASDNVHLIKSVKRTPNAYGETVTIELYDKQAALCTFAKHLGLLNDKMELTGRDGGPVQVQSRYSHTDAFVALPEYLDECTQDELRQLGVWLAERL